MRTDTDVAGKEFSSGVSSCAYRGVDQGLSAESLSRALGYFSIGLGLAQVLAPKRVCKAVGVKEQTGLMQALGVRELVTGVGILTQPHEQNWLWSRFVGDLIDIGLVSSVFEPRYQNNGGLSRLGLLLGGVAIADYYCAQQLAYQSDGSQRDKTFEASRSIIVDRPADEIFRFWRNFQNLPQIMQNLESVDTIDERRSHWVVKAPAGYEVEWDAEIVAEEPGKFIEWRTVQDADVEHYGRVTFEPTTGDRGTKIDVYLRYQPPGGAFGRIIAQILGRDPEQQLSQDLQRFKQFIETGEFSTTSGQPAGRKKGKTWMDKAASGRGPEQEGARE